MKLNCWSLAAALCTWVEGCENTCCSKARSAPADWPLLLVNLFYSYHKRRRAHSVCQPSSVPCRLLMTYRQVKLWRWELVRHKRCRRGGAGLRGMWPQSSQCQGPTGASSGPAAAAAALVYLLQRPLVSRTLKSDACYLINQRHLNF